MAKGLIKSVFAGAFEAAVRWFYGRKEKEADTSDAQAMFEGAFQNWGVRGMINQAVQDSRFDADASTRSELLRRSRFYEQNNSILQRLLDLFEEYTAGPTGLRLIPNSSSEDWNATATDWWNAWCDAPAIDNTSPLGVLQGLMARSWFVDGEIFVYKTFDKLGRPAIQLIEAHRVRTPSDMMGQEGTSIIDGVEINAKGTPVAYWVRSTPTNSVYGIQNLPGGGTQQLNSNLFERVDAANMLHLFEQSRPGMYRGLPMAYAVLNDIQDVHELQFLEMKAARDAAKVTNVVTNKTGEANLANSRRQRLSINSQDANGNATTKNVPVYHETTMGGETVFQVIGEKFEQFKSERPSVTTREYWDYLTAKICIGVGIPKMLVIPYQINGAAVRSDIETAAAYFRSRSAVLAVTMTRLYAWVMGWAKDFDRTLRGAPKDFAKVTVRPPKSVNVDIGRQSAAIIAELNAGIRSLADVCAELGTDWREVQEQRAREAANANKLALKYDVRPDQIAVIGVAPTPPPSEGSEEDDSDDEPMDKPKVNGNGHHRFQLA
jgi:capsid protein